MHKEESNKEAAVQHQAKCSFAFPICDGLLLRIVPALLLALALCGCASLESKNYPTLKQTKLNVEWPMTRYRNASYYGALTLAEKQRMNEAYAKYQAAFTQALQAAGGNYDAPTPDNVKALANDVLQTLSGIPLPG